LDKIVELTSPLAKKGEKKFRWKGRKKPLYLWGERKGHVCSSKERDRSQAKGKGDLEKNQIRSLHTKEGNRP